MRRISLSLALAGMLVLPVAAKADTFNFSVTSSAFSGSGTITTGSANANPAGSYTVTGITGTGITGLIAANDPDLGNDNLLFPAASRVFDVNGIAFTSTSGRINIFSTVAGYELQGFDLTGTYFDVNASSFSFNRAAAVTPEPNSLLLSFSGLFGLAAFVWRKRTDFLSA